MLANNHEVSLQLSDFEPYIKKVSKSLIGKAGNYSSIVEDVAQEMRIAWWDNSEKHPGLIKRIMLYHAIDFLRHYTHFNRRTGCAVKELSYEWLVSRGFTQASSLNEDCIFDNILLDKMLGELRNPDRELLVRSFIYDVTLSTIAKERGVSLSWISQKKCKCLEFLHRRYEHVAGDVF